MMNHLVRNHSESGAVRKTKQRRVRGISRAFVVAAACGAMTLPVAFAGAQGTLSGLGFGYPVGGTSTRTAATGGAFAEFDPLSPVNPASLGGFQRTLMTAQTEPEFRTLRFGNVKESTTAERVPLLMLIFPLPRNVALSLSGSTFLDRSYSTVTTGSVLAEGKSIATNDRSDVRGSIADLRAGLGWRVNNRVSVGIGGHLFTGDNSVARRRVFADTLTFGSVDDSSRVTYYGMALSVGGEFQIVKGLAVQGSYRAGGSLESRIRDTVRTQGSVPDRAGLSLRYDGIAGSTFAIGVEKAAWSQMKGLGSDRVQAHDATNIRAGAEVAGPKLRGSPVLLRVGFAKNQLPFGANSQKVKESRITGGLGLPIKPDFATVDISVQRANRTMSGGAIKEGAWMLGFGLQIRP